MEGKKTRDFCSYTNCNNWRYTPSRKLFSFPAKDEHRVALWLKNSGNEHLKNLSETSLRRCGVCSDHFEKKDFTTVNRLSSRAVPRPWNQSADGTIFVPNPPVTKTVANDNVANDRVANDRVANDRVANDRVANDNVATSQSVPAFYILTSAPVSTVAKATVETQTEEGFFQSRRDFQSCSGERHQTTLKKSKEGPECTSTSQSTPASNVSTLAPASPDAEATVAVQHDRKYLKSTLDFRESDDEHCEWLKIETAQPEETPCDSVSTEMLLNTISSLRKKIASAAEANKILKREVLGNRITIKELRRKVQRSSTSQSKSKRKKELAKGFSVYYTLLKPGTQTSSLLHP